MNIETRKMQLVALAVGASLVAVAAFSSFGTSNQTTVVQSDSEWMALQLQKAYANSGGIFLSYPGIAGEAKQVGHEGQIEISSFQFGSGRAVQPGSSVAGAPSLSEITVTKLSDKSTPLLFHASLVGKPPAINPAVISFSTTPEGTNKPVDYMTVKLSNPLISSYSVSSGGDRPSESISLSFTKIEITWIPINADGSKGTAITRVYDLAAAAKAT